MNLVFDILIKISLEQRHNFNTKNNEYYKDYEYQNPAWKRRRPPQRSIKIEQYKPCLIIFLFQCV